MLTTNLPPTPSPPSCLPTPSLNASTFTPLGQYLLSPHFSILLFLLSTNLLHTLDGIFRIFRPQIFTTFCSLSLAILGKIVLTFLTCFYRWKIRLVLVLGVLALCILCVLIYLLSYFLPLLCYLPAYVTCLFTYLLLHLSDSLMVPLRSTAPVSPTSLKRLCYLLFISCFRIFCFLYYLQGYLSVTCVQYMSL